MESELKLEFPSPDDMERLWRDPYFASLLMPDSESVEKYTSIYFDTKEQSLRDRSTSLRVRGKESGGYIHTIKRTIETGEGLHQRYEWNWETKQSDFDMEAFRTHAVSGGDPEEILNEIATLIYNQELAELFHTQFERKIFLVGFGDSLIEIALDFGSVLAVERKAAICEMEIELKKGDVRDVLALGEEIMARGIAKRSDISKYNRGIILLREDV